MRQDKKSEIIVLLSGGIDSTAIIHYYLQNRFPIQALFVDYGQAVAKKERRSAQAIARFFKIKMDTVKTRFSEKFLDGEIRGRNAFLILTALMEYQDFKGILSIGVHTGTVYYDCSEAFISRIATLVSDYTNGTVRLDTPFLKWDKRMIYEYFTKHKLPLGLTYSCERGVNKPCGQCKSCLDRKALSC